jgi:hypothetical protein
MNIEDLLYRPGKIIRTKSGMMARTFDSQKPVNGYIPIYPATDMDPDQPDRLPEKFYGDMVLCHPAAITVITTIN